MPKRGGKKKGSKKKSKGVEQVTEGVVSLVEQVSGINIHSDLQTITDSNLLPVGGMGSVYTSPMALLISPDAVDNTDNSSSEGLYIIKEAPGKGLGVFAMKPKARGTTIISEKPILQIPAIEALQRQGALFALKAFDNLSLADKTR